MRQYSAERAARPPAAEGAAPVPHTLASARFRVAFAVVVSVVVLVLGAVGINALLVDRDHHRFTPPGDLIDLSDGRELHLDISGVRGNGPTVVLDAGHGAFSPAMRHVQQALSEEVLVVSYDRPGYGWSDPVDSGREPISVVGDLHEALERAAVPGPYIVVGHSLGALYGRGFADTYPAEVVGIVLVDPAHEDQLDRLPDDVVTQMATPAWLDGPMLAAAHLGVLRVLRLGADTTAGLPHDAAAELGSLTVTPRYVESYLAEGRSFERLASAVRNPSPRHPTVVINAPVAAAGGELVRPAMDEMNRDLADRFPSVSVIELDGADHISIVTDRAHAERVAAVVLDLQRSAVTGTRP